MTTQQPEALAADHSGDATDMVGRWYMVNRDGMATLCASKADAQQEAADAQRFWPHMGPHRAVQLVEESASGFTAADMATASAQGFRDGVASIAASAGSEPVATYSVDADPLSIRSTVAEAITGALAFGAQGVNQPPEGHWLAPFWKAAREDKEAAELAHRDREIDRLRDENTTLQQGYAAARLEIESLQARIKTMAEEHADELMVAHMDGRMRAAQPAPQQEAQEPVMWAYQYSDGSWHDASATEHSAGMKPLYPAPQPQASGFTAPQADSQPALDEATAMNRTRELAESGRWPSDWVEAYRRGYSDRAARAPADSVLEDAARLDWLDENIFYREMGNWDAKYGHGDGYNMWVLFAPKGAQGSARSIIDAAMKKGGAE